MPSGLRQWCAAVLRRLFRSQLAGVRCASRIESKTVLLPGEYVQGASGLHIELSLLWPLLLPAFRPPVVAVQLMTPDNRPCGDGLQLVFTKGFRRTRIALDIPGDQLAGRESFRVRILRQKDGRPVAAVGFSALTVDRVTRELQLVRLDMRAVQQGQPIRCDRFHDAVEQVAFNLQLTLDNPDHRSFLTQMEATLHADVVADASPARVTGRWWQRSQFKGHSLGWDQRLGPATTVVREGLGGHRLSIGLGNRVIATKAFQVICLKECQDAARHLVRENVRLMEASFSATDHRKAVGPLEVVAEDFHSVDVSLVLDAPQPDRLLPEIDLPLAVSLQRGKQDLHRQQRGITLRRGQQRFKDSVSLKPEWFASGPGRYRIEVRLGDRLLKALDFQHKTRAQLKQEKAEALLRSLSLSEPRLFTVRDGERVQTDHVFATDRAVAPTFCIEGRGFDDDAPGLQWQLRLKLVNLDSGHTIEHSRALQARDGKNMHANVELPLRTPSRDLGPGCYTLQLCKRAEVLTEFRFRILAVEEIAPYTEKIVLQSLRADDAQLFIQAGATRYQCCQVPDTSDLLLPEVTICSAGYNAFLPQLQTNLQLFLVRAGEDRRELASLPVRLSTKPFSLQNVGLKVRDGYLGAMTGPCQLVVAIGDEDLASLPFEIVSQHDVLARIRVSAITLDASCKSGRQVRNPPSLQLNEHVFLSVSIEVETGILAPSAMVDGAITLCIGDAVLAHAGFALQLDRPTQTIRGGSMKLSALFPHKAVTPQELTVVVLIADEEKRTHTITILSAQRISNFEGQLTVDPHKLDVDEGEYRAILSRL